MRALEVPAPAAAMALAIPYRRVVAASSTRPRRELTAGAGRPDHESAFVCGAGPVPAARGQLLLY